MSNDSRITLLTLEKEVDAAERFQYLLANILPELLGVFYPAAPSVG